MALIPPWHSDCVVALGVRGQDGKTQWVATGFLYGHTTGENDANGNPLYWVHLVTNRHVFEGKKSIIVRFNPQAEEPAREYEEDLVKDDGTPLWVGHPRAEIDVAAVVVNFNVLKEHAIQARFFKNDKNVATVQKMKEVGITEGDFAYVLGFPMGLIGGQRNAVIVRGGPIARIRDVLARSNDFFLVDAPIFPGNSGGPVILKPEHVAIDGTQAVNQAFLIGIVQSYVPYREAAISLQTGRTRVIFEENSGLAAAHTVDHIEETVLRDIERLEQTETREVPSTPEPQAIVPERAAE